MRGSSLAILIVLAGCSTEIGSGADLQDARPISVREPPQPKEGSGTAPACDGVTARGECRAGIATYCDLDRNQLRRVDCAALGQSCVVDVSRGAQCDRVGSDVGDGTTPCADTGVSVDGFCSEDVAVFCDTDGDEPTTRTWDCGAQGQRCEVDTCAEGAACCGDAPAEDACGDLDFAGVCDGEIARWCGAGEPRAMDCGAAGKRCEVDTCSFGAYCCGDSIQPDPVDECAALGWEGACEGDTVRFCFNSEILEVTCAGTKSCQVDSCMSGAGCCEDDAAQASECTDLGFAGTCDGDTARWCDGETIHEQVCPSGTACQMNTCGNGAWCCNDDCEQLGPVGACDGDTLRYCTGDAVTEVDCAAQGKSCEVDTCFAGFAECC